MKAQHGESLFKILHKIRNRVGTLTVVKIVIKFVNMIYTMMVTYNNSDLSSSSKGKVMI